MSVLQPHSQSPVFLYNVSWRATSDTITILLLDGGNYTVAERSASLPNLTVTVLNDLRVQSGTLSRLNWIAAVQRWARANVPEQTEETVAQQ